MSLRNATLTLLKNPIFRFNRVPYEVCVYDPDPESWDESEWPEPRSDEDEDDYNERLKNFYEATQEFVQPDAATFELPSIPSRYQEYLLPGTRDLKPEKTVNIYQDYRERGLQVIVQLANIVLTQENPVYEGGTWHVEGQLNEHICASGIYYYDSENITTSRLAFRQQSQSEESSLVCYLQGHHDWIPVYMSSVQPFELVDHTKPGHRKIVALFLVDPDIRNISTANVPCQQRAWWAEEVRLSKGGIGSLPLEIQDSILNGVDDFPITLEEAKMLRERLIEERKKYMVMHEQQFVENEFSLCEH